MMRSFTLACIVVAVLAWIPSLRAQEAQAFSPVELKKLTSVKPTDGCLEFEATFSGPLKGAPSATADVERFHGLEGVLSRIMEVFSIGQNRYRLKVKDAQVCEAFHRAGKDVEVSVTEAEDENGRLVFPDQKNFPLK